MHAIAAKTLDLSCEVSGLLTKSCEAGGSWKSWSWTNSLNFSRLQFPSTSWHLCTTCPSIQARGEPSRRCWRVGKSKAALENLPGSPTVWRTISLYPCSWSTILKKETMQNVMSWFKIFENIFGILYMLSCGLFHHCSSLTLVPELPDEQQNFYIEVPGRPRLHHVSVEFRQWSGFRFAGAQKSKNEETLRDLSVPTWFKDI